jgi:KDO2-lipid IV(A) lauroyltransferase
MASEQAHPVRIRHRLEAGALGGLLTLLGALPPRLRYAVAGRLGQGARFIDRRHARIARESLALRYGEAGVAAKVRAVFRELGHLAAEIPLLERKESGDLGELVRTVEGREHLDRAMADPRGVLLLGVHGGNWELLAHLLPQIGIHPLHAVYRPLDNPILEERLRASRERHGAQPIARKNASRHVMAALRRGETVAMLLDQHTKKGTVQLPFLGEPARVSTSLARFARKADAPILPIFLVREAPERFRLVVFPAIEPGGYPDSEEGVRDLTAEAVAAMEAGIALAPAQWFWVHRRWRQRPRELIRGGPPAPKWGGETPLD